MRAYKVESHAGIEFLAAPNVLVAARKFGVMHHPGYRVTHHYNVRGDLHVATLMAENKPELKINVAEI